MVIVSAWYQNLLQLLSSWHHNLPPLVPDKARLCGINCCVWTGLACFGCVLMISVAVFGGFVGEKTGAGRHEPLLFVYLCEKNGFQANTQEEVQVCAKQHFLSIQEEAWCRLQGHVDLDTPAQRSACDTFEFATEFALLARM